MSLSRSSPTRLAISSILLALLLPAGLLSQTLENTGLTPTGLKILSTTLDPATHEASVGFENVTGKTVVAYGLTVQSWDSEKKLISDKKIEFDYVAPEPNQGKIHFIPPMGMSSAYLVLTPDVQFLQVTVYAVVFEDLSFEGDSNLIFHNRRLRAEAARQGLRHLGAFPATREENRKAMAALRVLGLNPPDEALSKEHWAAIRRDVEAKVAWWDSQKWAKSWKERANQ
jgi:hypothetical protein